jgi:preprotein translocase subunit SecF
MIKFKLPANKHIFLIISCIILAIGMAIGTVCHFIAGGFFNYGSEFSAYNSINVTYLAAEQTEEGVKQICNTALDGLTTADISSSEVSFGGEIIYKFTTSVDTDKLQAATDAINTALSADGGLSAASLVTATTYVGGLRSLNYAFIALASAVAFGFIYFAIRYRFAAAFTSIVSNVFSLGLYIALLAITRVPVGIEAVALGCVAVLVSMIVTGLFCNKMHRSLKEENADKQNIDDMVNSSLDFSAKFSGLVICFIVVAIAVLAIFALCAFLSPASLAPCAAAVLALVACACTNLCFMPCIYSIFKGIADGIKNKSKK